MSETGDEFAGIAGTIGELRADSRRHTETCSTILAELRRTSEQIQIVKELTVELREYRKTLHERFDRINEAASSHTLDIDDLDKRTIALERRVDKIETTWKTQLRLIAGVGAICLTIGGWVAGTYGPVLFRLLVGG